VSNHQSFVTNIPRWIPPSFGGMCGLLVASRCNQQLAKYPEPNQPGWVPA